MDATLEAILKALCPKGLGPTRPWREVEAELRARDRFQQVTLPKLKFLEDEPAST